MTRPTCIPPAGSIKVDEDLLREAIVRSDPLEASPADYEERYSLTGNLLLPVTVWLTALLVAVVAFVVGLAQQPEPPGDLVGHRGFWGVVAILVLLVALLGGCSAGWLAAAIRGQVAIRIDQHGVLLGRLPFPPRRPVLIPWDSIESIVTDRIGGGHDVGKRLFGVRLRPSEVARRHTVVTRWQALWPIFLGISPSVERMRRGWDVDMIALQRSVWRYGPHVRILNFR
jgi:hypothetical protein